MSKSAFALLVQAPSCKFLTREKTKNITCRFNSDVGSSSRLCDPPSRSHTQPSGRRNAGTGNCEAVDFGDGL